jgi:hypothetical protein
MGVVDDLYTYIGAQNLAGGSTGWQLLRRRMLDPESGGVDQQVTISEDGGEAPEIKANNGIGDSALSNPGALITVRAAAWDSDASFAKAAAILAALHGQLSSSLVGSGTVYFRVRTLTSEPVFAGFDDQGRPIHTIGLRLLRAA